jgi:hypothetical protein
VRLGDPLAWVFCGRPVTTRRLETCQHHIYFCVYPDCFVFLTSTLRHFVASRLCDSKRFLYGSCRAQAGVLRHISASKLRLRRLSGRFDIIRLSGTNCQYTATPWFMSLSLPLLPEMRGSDNKSLILSMLVPLSFALWIVRLLLTN